MVPLGRQRRAAVAAASADGFGAANAIRLTRIVVQLVAAGAIVVRALPVRRCGLWSNRGFATSCSMALKATIFKASLQIADMDRSVYADHNLTLARHPSETDERMMMRLLAFGLNARADGDEGQLEFGKGLSDTDEPDLWHRDLTGRIVHWVEVGQPDDRRLLRAGGRAERVSVYSYSASTPIWWSGIVNKVSRAPNLEVWQVPAAQSQALAALARRTMQLQLTVQDGTAWLGDGTQSVEVTPERLNAR
jgi:uncharacterized protein YaeQ